MSDRERADDYRVTCLVADHCAAAMALAKRDRLFDDMEAWVVADAEFNKLETAYRENLTTALAAARREEREACMAAQCSYCREGVPYDDQARRHRDGCDVLYECGAAAIRARGEEKQG